MRDRSSPEYPRGYETVRKESDESINPASSRRRNARSKTSASARDSSDRKLSRRTTAPHRLVETRYPEAALSLPSSQQPGNELAILVMGVTGSGKSTFISRLTQDEVGIGHSLESCTAEVEAYTIAGPGGEKIHLIDTPGFDDTQTSDVDLLRKIASALEAMYLDNDIRFAGLIYMHRITDQRVAGSSLKSLRIFEKLCGEENFPCVVLVTSMWNMLGNGPDWKIGEDRERTLESKDEFFGKMVAGGAKVMRDQGDPASAQDIIACIAKQKSRVVTALQREMADVGKTLEDTAIGALLREHLDQAHRRYELEREELEEALEEARRDHDNDLISSISDQYRELGERVKQTMEDEQNLSSTKEDLAEFRTEWSQEILAEVAEKEREVQESQKRITSLERRLELQEEQHRRELRSLEKQAKGDQHALQRSASEMQALEVQLCQQRHETEAKSKGWKIFSKNKQKLLRLVRGAPPETLQPSSHSFHSHYQQPSVSVYEPRSETRDRKGTSGPPASVSGEYCYDAPFIAASSGLYDEPEELFDHSTSASDFRPQSLLTQPPNSLNYIAGANVSIQGPRRTYPSSQATSPYSMK